MDATELCRRQLHVDSLLVHNGIDDFDPVLSDERLLIHPSTLPLSDHAGREQRGGARDGNEPNVCDILESPWMIKAFWSKPFNLLYETTMYQWRGPAPRPTTKPRAFHRPAEIIARSSLIQLDDPRKLSRTLEEELGLCHNEDLDQYRVRFATPPEFVRFRWENRSSSIQGMRSREFFDVIQAFEIMASVKQDGDGEAINYLTKLVPFRLICAVKVAQEGEEPVMEHLYDPNGRNVSPYSHDGYAEWSCVDPGDYYLVYHKPDAKRHDIGPHSFQEPEFASTPMDVLEDENIAVGVREDTDEDWLLGADLEDPTPYPNPHISDGSVQPAAPDTAPHGPVQPVAPGTRSHTFYGSVQPVAPDTRRPLSEMPVVPSNPSISHMQVQPQASDTRHTSVVPQGSSLYGINAPLPSSFELDAPSSLYGTNTSQPHASSSLHDTGAPATPSNERVSAEAIALWQSLTDPIASGTYDPGQEVEAEEEDEDEQEDEDVEHQSTPFPANQRRRKRGLRKRGKARGYGPNPGYGQRRGQGRGRGRGGRGGW
ncbi:hypothetical protein F5Y13DRAFT_162257 [Hypoxylon sp. FL1857]|nr:hypothetical protein F5Y13DRAFT_162257 [Hypoxylon sp. FL1857]